MIMTLVGAVYGGLFGAWYFSLEKGTRTWADLWVAVFAALLMTCMTMGMVKAVCTP